MLLFNITTTTIDNIQHSGLQWYTRDHWDRSIILYKNHHSSVRFNAWGIHTTDAIRKLEVYNLYRF